MRLLVSWFPEIPDRPRNEADGPVPPRPGGLGGFGSLVPRPRIRVNLMRSHALFLRAVPPWLSKSLGRSLL